MLSQKSPFSVQVPPVFLVTVITSVLGLVLVTIGGVRISNTPATADGFVAMVILGSLLLLFSLIFTVMVCCTQPRRLDDYRRRQNAKRLVRHVLRTERAAGRLTSQLTSEETSRLVQCAACSGQETVSYNHILRELESMTTGWIRPPAYSVFTLSDSPGSLPHLELGADPGFEPPPPYEEVVVGSDQQTGATEQSRVALQKY